MDDLSKTNGSPWDISAISNAKWTGVRLRDVLASVGVTEDVVYAEGSRIKVSMLC
jgi:DMSO/TMAO reductase YedYZ molybdopterin-dependent catalytic subunit